MSFLLYSFLIARIRFIPVSLTRILSDPVQQYIDVFFVITEFLFTFEAHQAPVGLFRKAFRMPVKSDLPSDQQSDRAYNDAYTIQEANGGWEDNGTRYEEYTLVIYLSDTTKEDVHAAANEMISTFNQSSVLIQENKTTTEFYAGDNE